MKWSILYRGPLSSCNYGCSYCPFAKTKNTRSELADDAKRLQNFVDWVSSRSEQISILFTPWGEGLIRKYYQEAMTTLSHLPQVQKVSIQTNLSCPTTWMDKVNKEAFALWTTFHPSQISLDKFVGKCQELDDLAIQYSVGFVAFKNELDILEQLRDKIHSSRYVWANAYKRVVDYYTEEEIQRIEQVDPLFRYNTKYHDSFGKSCQAGYRSFTVDGNGDVRSCHFINTVLGNIYKDDVSSILAPRLCSNATCGCHIGYVHLDELKLYDTYADGILERIPSAYRP
ncbi:STM4011 family radical SAM protein [Aureispira anguillae]|uniref:STM4011 family radical SAM protein n=1 Tax=Aureispira anguillae TaxID=2864201 RepID=A0A915YHP5_9BACT|nr:STM4011 family radical SAM protein [Aureispira anguillae]BDS13268.1 STM4011 family radical SAM protein [Aureispira anguillae]